MKFISTYIVSTWIRHWLHPPDGEYPRSATDLSRNCRDVGL